MEIEENIMQLIAETGKLPRGEVNAKLKVYDSGLISSLALLELMSRFEREFRIIIQPEELIPDNFRDVQAIINFLKRKTA